MDPNAADPNRGPELLAIIWVFTSICIVVFGLKVYTRLTIVKETGIDDILTAFSLLIIACAIVFSTAVCYGMGQHVVHLAPENARFAIKLNLIGNPFGVMAYSIPNLAVVIFINRILVLSTPTRVFLFAMAIVQNIVAAISCVLLFTQCRPTESLWNPLVEPSSCLSSGILSRYSYFVGAFTAFTDLVLAVFPVYMFRGLQMKSKTKIAVSILMSMTGVAAICAIVKTSKLHELTYLDDFTYAPIDLIITAIVEANVMIIAACTPSLNPFVRSVRESIAAKGKLRWPSKVTSASDAVECRTQPSAFTNKGGMNKTTATSKYGAKPLASASDFKDEEPWFDGDGVLKKTEVSTSLDTRSV